MEDKGRDSSDDDLISFFPEDYVVEPPKPPDTISDDELEYALHKDSRKTILFLSNVAYFR